MIQFREDEVCQLIKAITYYRDYVTGSDKYWDDYNNLAIKLHRYGEDVSPAPVSCENNKEN